jgi:hypothetical protein
MAKDGNGIFIKKLMEVHVNTSKVLTRVICIKKIKKLKKKIKMKIIKLLKNEIKNIREWLP